MKKLIMGALAVSLAFITGCKPTVEQIKATATAVGYAAGLVANETPIKEKARNTIVDILGEVRGCVPAEGQSFADAWEPVIKEKVAALVKSGKIDSATGEIVTMVALMAAKGVDYLFNVRFPEARKYEELVAAGVSGAVDGFLATFKPVNGHGDDSCDDCTLRRSIQKDYDKDAYKWLKSHK